MKGWVQNIPQCLIWGDVLDVQYHATKTQSYVSMSWASAYDCVFLLTDIITLYLILSGGSWHPFVHLLKWSGVFVTLLLVIFLLSIIETKLILWPLAHKDAHTVGVLHCDISTSNIVLTDSGGVLINWDMAKDARRFTLKGVWHGL